MTFRNDTPSKPIPIACNYTSTGNSPDDKNKPSSFVEISFAEMKHKPVSYKKIPQTLSKNSGTYGRVFVYERTTPADAIPFETPNKIAGKEFNLQGQTQSEIVEESKHARLALGWTIDNVTQLYRPTVMLFQPLIEDQLFGQIKFDKASTLFDACVKVLEAIQQFHKEGHIHCDINSANVFVGNLAKLIDFGQSRFTNKKIKSLYAADYRAPEASRLPIPNATAALDIFSAGYMFLYDARINFSLNPYIKKAFRKIIFEMLHADPAARPSLETLIPEFKRLANQARSLEEDKFTVDTVFSDLKSLLECEIHLTVKTRISYLESLSTKELERILKPHGLDRNSFLMEYLYTEDPKKVIVNSDILCAIMNHYPSHTLSALLRKIGLNHVKTLIKTNADLEKIKILLSSETSNLLYEIVSVYEYFQCLESLFGNLNVLQTEFKKYDNVRQGNIDYYDDKKRCSVQCANLDINSMLAELAKKLSTPDAKEVASFDLPFVGRMVADMFKQWQLYTHCSFHSVEYRHQQLCVALQSNDPAKMMSIYNATIEAVSLGCWGYFLTNQDFLCNRKNPLGNLKEWTELLMVAVKDLGELLTLTLDFYPHNRYYFMRLDKIDHINKIIDQVPILKAYLQSDRELRDHVKNMQTLTYFLQYYPVEVRVRVLENVGLNHLKTIIKDKANLDELLLYIPQHARANIIKDFDFKKPESLPVSTNIHGFHNLAKPQNNEPLKSTHAISLHKH